MNEDLLNSTDYLVFWGDGAVRPQCTVCETALPCCSKTRCHVEKNTKVNALREFRKPVSVLDVIGWRNWWYDCQMTVWGFKMQWTSWRFDFFLIYLLSVVVVLDGCFSFYINIFKIYLQEELVLSIHITLLVAQNSWWSVRGWRLLCWAYSSCDLLTFWCARVCYLCASIIQKAADRYLELSWSY